MISKELLGNRINQTALNFKFKLGEDFKPFFDIIFDQVKHQSEVEIDKKFQQLWLTPIADWHKKYGFGGYPALSDWLEILNGQRPLTDAEKAEELRQYEMRMKIFIGYIVAWLYQPSIVPHRYFIEKYCNPENKHLRSIIDKFAKVGEELTDDRLCKLAEGLKAKYENDKNSFVARLIGIAKEQNPAPFAEKEKIEQKNNIVKLPVFKRF